MGCSLGSEHYRSDGVKILHDPYAPGMVEKYGKPGMTDAEGFDPYADTVGPGIYGGIVQRARNGKVVIGMQYQNHNPKPGPLYAGGGYTPINKALKEGKEALKPLLDKYPDLANDVSTGGAQPLHMCGMSKEHQDATEYLILRGANIEALDTYGMTPLHRMASNNLAAGARALLEAGADPEGRGKLGATPLKVAQEARADAVVAVLQEYLGKARTQPRKLSVIGSGTKALNQLYLERDPKIVPPGFSITCAQQAWDPEQMWLKLSDQQAPWFEAENGSYIYWNQADGQWWIDAPDGKGIYVAKAPGTKPPAEGWEPVAGWMSAPMPTLKFKS